MLDFYRGTLTPRRLGLLVRHLPVESALVRALNDGQPPWLLRDHLLADLWSLNAKQDHPRRIEMEAKALAAVKAARIAALRAKFEKRKRTYKIEGVT